MTSRTRTTARHIGMPLSTLALVALVAFAVSSGALAQTAEDRARIDYAAAKRALEQGRPEVALERLERVMESIGELPDLLLLSAKAALAVGRVSRAGELVGRAFATADDAFKGSPAYQELVDLAAEIEVYDPAREAAQRGYLFDEGTGLMWAARDNGHDIDWAGANEHCRSLTAGGLGGWRLPTIEELEKLYQGIAHRPREATAVTPRIQAACREQELTHGWCDGLSRQVPGIAMTGPWYWSGTMNGSSEAWGLGFISGQRASGLLGLSFNLRALCVLVPER